MFEFDSVCPRNILNDLYVQVLLRIFVQQDSESVEQTFLFGRIPGKLGGKGA